MDIYENIVIGNFLYGAGAAMGRYAKAEGVPLSVNLLQQTPTSDEIKALRDERAQLQQDIALLKQKGAKTDFTSCLIENDKRQGRLCARLDPAFGDQWDGYRILKNK